MSDSNQPGDLLRDAEELIVALGEALRCGGGADVAQVLEIVGDALPSSDECSGAVVDVLVYVLSNEAFLSQRDSWRMLYFLLHNWDWLRLDGRDDVAAAIASAFDRFSDWMGAFIAAEILGEKCANAFAMARLHGLAMEARLPARRLVPHGLKCLVQSAQVDAVGRHALDALQLMLKDSDEECRAEAEKALRKLRRSS